MQIAEEPDRDLFKNIIILRFFLVKHSLLSPKVSRLSLSLSLSLSLCSLSLGENNKTYITPLSETDKFSRTLKLVFPFFASSVII